MVDSLALGNPVAYFPRHQEYILHIRSHFEKLLLQVSSISSITMSVTEITVTYGRQVREIFCFTDQLTLDTISYYVNTQFSDLPNRFHFQCYTSHAMFVIVDNNLLESFRKQCSTNHTLHFFIVRDDPPVVSTNVPDLICSNTYFSNLNSIDDIDAALLMQTMFTQNSSLSNSETYTQLNPSLINDNSSAQTSSLSDEYQVAIQVNDTVLSSDRLKFSCDVYPRVKHHYLSDKFNGETGDPTNGDIPRLQGWKTDEQIKNSESVYPEIQVKV